MKRNIDTTIQFSGLKTGIYEYTFSLNNSFFSAFENEYLQEGEVEFAVKLEKAEQFMMFTFSFSGHVERACDRCLEMMTVPVEGEETLCIKFSDTEVSDKEDVVVLPEKAYKIDLGQWMYEYVLVALPMRCVHPCDENGIPTCNPEMLQYISTLADNNEEQRQSEPDPFLSDLEDDEVDPRWKKLLELK